MKLVGITDKKWVNHNEIDDKPILMYFLFLNWKVKPKMSPVMRINVIIFLFSIEIIKSCSEDNNHVSKDPDVIPNNLRIEIGISEYMDLWFDENGCDLIRVLFDDKDIRIEYEAVIPIDKVIMSIIIKFILDEIINSIIVSLEKNPDINGIPIKAILFSPRIDWVSGYFKKFNPIIRISWYVDSWIMIPAHKNIVDLNRAWIIRWI